MVKSFYLILKHTFCDFIQEWVIISFESHPNRCILDHEYIVIILYLGDFVDLTMSLPPPLAFFSCCKLMFTFQESWKQKKSEWVELLRILRWPWCSNQVIKWHFTAMLALGDAKPHGVADPEFVRTKAADAYNLFATSARAILQHGTNEEAWIVHSHIQIYLFCAAVTWLWKVAAYRDAMAIILQLRHYTPQWAETLKPTSHTGGRPSYTLLQLYHCMKLTLGWTSKTFGGLPWGHGVIVLKRFAHDSAV